MAEFLDFYKDIVFLDSELEPDDDSAPVGDLITVDDEGRAYKAEPAPTFDTAPVFPAAEESYAPVQSQPVEEQPAVEEPAVEQPVEAVEEQPDKSDAEGDLSAALAANVDAYFANADEEQAEPSPAENETAEQDLRLVAETPIPAAEETEEAPVEEETVAPAPEETPVPGPAKEEEVAPAQSAELPTPEEAAANEEGAVTYAPVEEAPAAAAVAEEPVAEEEEAPAPVQTAPKKKAKTESHVIFQSASDGGDLWGNAVIKTSKPKAEKKPEPVAEEEEALPKPKKSTAKKAAPSSAEVNKEETKVAKEKATSDKTKKDAAKPAAKPAEKKAAAKAAPAKETASAKKSAAKAAPAEEKAAAKKTAAKPAAKPVAKPVVKEETKPAEQVIEAGDDSAPHGKFIIKKTDKGNFVYKLYSSNYRVVAIGAGLYTSISSCKTGINSVRSNAATAPIEDQTLQKWEELKFPKWQIYTDKQGEIRLRLLASNGNIVATTNDGYLSKEAAKKGIAAIARAAKGAAIVRNDDLW